MSHQIAFQPIPTDELVCHVSDATYPVVGWFMMGSQVDPVLLMHGKARTVMGSEYEIERVADIR